MKIFRWIICAPIAIVAFLLIELLIDISLEWLYKCSFWRYPFELLGITKVVNAIMGVIYFIFTSCINPIFSAIMAGSIGGHIYPSNNQRAAYFLFGIVVAPITILRCITSWNLDNTFLSLICIVVALITGFSFVWSTATSIEEKS